jgi:hypothetical protein
MAKGSPAAAVSVNRLQAMLARLRTAAFSRLSFWPEPRLNMRGMPRLRAGKAWRTVFVCTGLATLRCDPICFSRLAGMTWGWGTVNAASNKAVTHYA